MRSTPKEAQAVIKLNYCAKEAAFALGVSAKTLANWRSNGFGPAYIKIGNRVYYPISDLKEWVNEMPRARKIQLVTG